MSGKTKIWLVTAFSLILIGTVIFMGVMFTLKWDFTMLSTIKYETAQHIINESFDSVFVDTDTADVVFALSESDECSVRCYERENETHKVSVKDGTLEIKLLDERKWYQHIGISFASPKITIYLPMESYRSLSVKADTGKVDIPSDFRFESIDVSVSTGDVRCDASASGRAKIKTSTGDIRINNISVDTLDLAVSTGAVRVYGLECAKELSLVVSTGKTTLSDVLCGSLSTNGSTGGITLKNVIVSGKLSVKRSTGGVKLEGCDAAEIYIKTSTGSVKGSLLSQKIFIVDTDTGSKKVPDSLEGGRCEIITSTGDIKIEIVNKNN